jgi:hypothetical protein
VCGVGGDVLGGVHGDRVAQRDVLPQIVGVEDDAGVVGEPFGGNPIGVGIDGDDAPAVAVAHLIHRVSPAVSGAGSHGDDGIVSPAHDEVTDADLQSAGCLGGRARGSDRIEPRFGAWHVARIDHQSIQTWVNEMVASGLSPRTVRWMHSVLKMTLDYAIEDGQLLSRNPASRTKFPAQRQTSHTYLTTTEVAALTLACGTQGDVVSLLAYTGMRFGELIGLRVEDVDLDARRIRVRRSITQVGGKLVEGIRSLLPADGRYRYPNGSCRSSPVG